MKKLLGLAALFLLLDSSAYGQVPVNPSGITQIAADARYCGLAGCNIVGATTIVVTDNTNPALKVQQAGTGDALLVNDVNNDTSPFVIDQNGVIITGTTAAQTFASSAVPRLQLISSSLPDVSTLGLQNWSSTVGNSGTIRFAKARGQTIGTHTIVSTSDILGTIKFSGSDGVAFIPSASITAGVGATPGVNDMPGTLTFSTTADGAAAVTDRMVIDHAGGILIASAGKVTSPAINYAADAGSNDTYVITLAPVPTAYSTGMHVIFKANTANTGAASLNVNGLGAVTIVKAVSTTLANNDILANMFCLVVYDGTNFVLMNPRAL